MTGTDDTRAAAGPRARRRLSLIALGAVLLALAAWAAWRALLAPPLDDATALADAVVMAPDGGGVLVIAAPRRAVPWLARHPQAAGLIALAGIPEQPRRQLEPLLEPLVGAARGPLVAFWDERDAGIAAVVDQGAADALLRLAATTDLVPEAHPHAAGRAVRLATAAELLAAQRAAPPPVEGELSALVRVNGRWWRARAERDRLLLTAGSPPAPPALDRGSRFATADAARLVAAAGLSRWNVGGLAAVIDERGWGIRVTRSLAPMLETALRGLGDVGDPPPDGARRWTGLAGTIWVLTGERTALASDRDHLIEVGLVAADEHGAVRGADLARAIEAVARLAEVLPVGRDRAARLRRAGRVAGELEALRWRIAPDGAVLVLEW